MRLIIEHPPSDPVDDLLASVPFIRRHALEVAAHGRAASDLARLEAFGGVRGSGNGFTWVELRFEGGGELVMFLGAP